jgi:hypothetical protein
MPRQGGISDIDDPTGDWGTLPACIFEWAADAVERHIPVQEQTTILMMLGLQEDPLAKGIMTGRTSWERYARTRQKRKQHERERQAAAERVHPQAGTVADG